MFSSPNVERLSGTWFHGYHCSFWDVVLYILYIIKKNMRFNSPACSHPLASSLVPWSSSSDEDDSEGDDQSQTEIRGKSNCPLFFVKYLTWLCSELFPVTVNNNAACRQNCFRYAMREQTLAEKNGASKYWMIGFGNPVRMGSWGPCRIFRIFRVFLCLMNIIVSHILWGKRKIYCHS